MVHETLGAALAAAQAELQNPPLKGTNPHFKSKFATLADVRNAVVPVLAKHGIAVIQDLVSDDGLVGCRTVLLHESGSREEFGPLFMPAEQAKAHAYGSAATYARRYTLQAIAGVVGEQDDDGNGAVAEAPSSSPKGTSKATGTKGKAKAPKGPSGALAAMLDVIGGKKTRKELEALRAELSRGKKDLAEGEWVQVTESFRAKYETLPAAEVVDG